MEKKTLLDMLSQVTKVELVYRFKVKASQRPWISSSLDAYNVLKELWDEDKIDLVVPFKVLFLNRANRCFATFLFLPVASPAPEPLHASFIQLL